VGERRDEPSSGKKKSETTSRVAPVRGERESFSEGGRRIPAAGKIHGGGKGSTKEKHWMRRGLFQRERRKKVTKSLGEKKDDLRKKKEEAKGTAKTAKEGRVT